MLHLMLNCFLFKVFRDLYFCNPFTHFFPCIGGKVTPPVDRQLEVGGQELACHANASQPATWPPANRQLTLDPDLTAPAPKKMNPCITERTRYKWDMMFHSNLSDVGVDQK